MRPNQLLKLGQSLRRTHRPIASVGILDGHRLLLVQHGRGNNRDRWNLPGGKVRRGEDFVAAAVRETREETGLDADIRQAHGLYRYPGRSGKLHLRMLFLADINGGQLAWDGDEIINAAWFHFEQFSALDDDQLCKPDVLRRMVQQLRRPRPQVDRRLQEISRAALAQAS